VGISDDFYSIWICPECGSIHAFIKGTSLRDGGICERCHRKMVYQNSEKGNNYLLLEKIIPECIEYLSDRVGELYDAVISVHKELNEHNEALGELYVLVSNIENYVTEKEEDY